MSQYNSFASEYEKWMETPLKIYAWRETVSKNIKEINVEGKRVLDIACGTGRSIEILYQNGAKEVVGLDVSEEQINIARDKFPETKFILGDISNWDYDELGEFDVVTGVFLLEYAMDKEALTRMTDSIYRLLKSGGVFYSLTVDPLVLDEGGNYYGITGQRPESEGDKYTCTLHNEYGKKLHSVDMYYWSAEVIKSLIIEAGFTKFERMDLSVSDEGIKKYGAEYWSEYLTRPMYLVFKAQK